MSYNKTMTDIDNMKDLTNLQEEPITILMMLIIPTIFNEIKCNYDLYVESSNDKSNNTGYRDNIQVF